MSAIAFILPYKELAQRALYVAQEHDERIIVEMGLLEESIDVAKRLEAKNDVKVIIARGGTALILKEEAEVRSTIVELDITEYDLIVALMEAKQYGDRIGFVGFSNMLQRIERLASLFQVDLIKKVLERTAQTPNFLEEIKDSVDVIIGGVITNRWSKIKNINTILIDSTNETIRRSIRDAYTVLEIFYEEKKKRKEIQMILNLFKDGIIGLDIEERITYINAVAANMLSVKIEEALHQPIRTIFPQSDLPLVLKTGREKENRIKEIKGRIVHSNGAPIVIEGNVVGAMEILQDVSTIEKMEKKIREEIYAKGHYAKYTFDDLLGASKRMGKVLERAKKFSQVDSSILIYGETGTGKELLAQSIHNASARKNDPFVAVNCAALPEDLLESELFGYVEGAFTGARKGGKRGLFELAHRGTIFLDEVSEMTPKLQSRLLRVIEEQEVRRIGDDQVILVNLRLIAASNKELMYMIRENRFRKDLYYRLNVLTIQIPPLRERLDDIDSIAPFFAQLLGAKLGKPASSISPQGLSLLKEQSWPGNIRELRNILERAVVLCNEETISFDLLKDLLEVKEGHFLEEIQSGEERGEDSLKNLLKGLDLKELLQSLEQMIIRDSLEKNRGNITKTAQELGLHRSTVWRKLQ